MRVKTIGSLGYHRPDVVTLRGTARGMGGFFDAPSEAASAEQVALVYPARESRLSLLLARRPVLWSLGLFAAGWAGGYLTWVAIGKRR